MTIIVGDSRLPSLASSIPPQLAHCKASPSAIAYPTPPLCTTASMLASRVAARSARVAAPRMSVAATRSYAEPAKPAAQANTKPPVALFGLDGTYASALV